VSERNQASRVAAVRAPGCQALFMARAVDGTCQEAHVSGLTSLLREGPVGDRLAGWAKPMRVFARRERPHPAPS